MAIAARICDGRARASEEDGRADREDREEGRQDGVLWEAWKEELCHITELARPWIRVEI